VTSRTFAGEASVSQLQGRVLVMDDEEIVRQVLEEALDGLGLRVDTVADSVRALEAARVAIAANDRYQLAILDLTIPGGLGGVETLRRLRAVDPSLRAIASSGYSSDPVMSNPTGFGFQATLAKPYSVTDIGRTVATALGGPGPVIDPART